MTIQELINMLEEIEDKTQLVLVASDDEGNQYLPLYDGFTENIWYTGDGDILEESDDLNNDEDYYDIIQSSERAIILWPGSK